MQVLAIHTDPPFIRLALLETSGGKTEIVYLKSPLIEEPETVKRLYSPPFKGKAVSGLSARQLFMRRLEVKTVSGRHLEQAFAFQMEAVGHLSLQETLFAPCIVKQDKEKTEALIFAASRDALRAHLQEMEKFELDPDLVSAVPVALVRYVRWKFPFLEEAFIVDVGSEEWTCALMEKGHLKMAHATESGIEDLFNALWEDRKKIIFQKEIRGIAKQIDLMQLQSHLNPHLSQRLSAARTDFAKILYAFHREAGPKPLIFTGRVDSFGRLKEYLLGAVQEFIAGGEGKEIPPDEQKYAAAIGLGLCYEKNALQFRKEEFFPQKNWRVSGVYATALLAISFGLSAVFITLGHRQANAREEAMVAHLQQSLQFCDSDLKKAVFQTDGAEDVLQRWAKVVKTNAKDFPYILTVPNVSEFLQWLDHYPVLVKFKEDRDPIVIESIDYKLEKYPSLQGEKQPYAARIVLEFTTKNALNARQFHEALLEDRMIDHSQEVAWESTDSVYRTSFYLKEKDHVL